MLTNPVIAGQCSSFAVEWTWEDGTGRQTDPAGNLLPGLVVRGDTSAPWFGMPNAERGTQALSSSPAYDGTCQSQWGCLGAPIFPAAIEGNTPVQTFTGGVLSGVRLYRATFGYNTSQALDGTGSPNLELGYTPWPTALRFTFTLHDPEQRFTDGRTFQFVVELPRR
jgi:hypothetical protein